MIPHGGMRLVASKDGLLPQRNGNVFTRLPQSGTSVGSQGKAARGVNHDSGTDRANGAGDILGYVIAIGPLLTA